MKTLRILMLVVLAICVAAPLMAQCPDSGYYRTNNGTLYPARASEAWCGNYGYPQQAGVPGNTENVMSWDTANLGSMYRIWGQEIDENGAVMVNSNVDENGNGYIDYDTNYVGGFVWMSGNYPWSPDGMDLTGTVSYYNVSARVSLINGDISGITSNIYMSGAFDNCEDCEIAFTIANAALVWRSDSGLPMPSNYPSFECGVDQGELFYVCCIFSAITCGGVQSEGETWGGVKSLFR